MWREWLALVLGIYLALSTIVTIEAIVEDLCRGKPYRYIGWWRKGFGEGE